MEIRMVNTIKLKRIQKEINIWKVLDSQYLGLKTDLYSRNLNM